MSSSSSFKPELFSDKIVLAPMVRANNLPFRLLCLKYEADLVYTEELIDYRLASCRRLENKVLATVDYIDDAGEIILRTCPDLERDKLILQIGSNNPERALKAAKLVRSDISGLDFNFGCPKAFSLSGGMGAALLEKPNQIKSLITSAVECLVDLPVTCKIRLLPELDETLKLVELIEQCGVSALAVHGRTKDQRPRHENQNESLRIISEKLKTVPMIANGGSNCIKSYSDILKFKAETNASSVMVARAAMRNPSIFRSDNQLESAEKLAEEYIKLAIKYDNYVSSTKYSLQTILSSGHFGSEFISKFHAAGDMQAICDLFPGLCGWYEANKLSLEQRRSFYDEGELGKVELEKFCAEKRAKLLEHGISIFVCDIVPYNSKIYGSKSPKAQLCDHVNKGRSKPEYEVFQLDNESGKKGGYHCTIIIDNVCYFNKAYANSKKNAEHSSAMLACERLNLVDLDKYRAQVASTCCGRNVT